MRKEMLLQTLNAVINTLNGTTIRADQHDAYQRINACVNELKHVMQEIQKEEQPEQKEG